MRFARLGRRACSALLRCGVALAIPLHSSSLRAEQAGLSAYERRTLEEAARRAGVSAAVATEPEGKLIERVDVVLLDVFDEHDPIPDFANVLHVTTREYVVRRELLFRAGETYRSERVEESARILRTLRQFSLVLVVPFAGSTPERVRIVVVTRDVWSLRINIEPEGAAGPAGTAVTSLIVNPTEENFLGTHSTVGALFTLDPGSYSLGASAGHRRLFGSDLELNLSANVVYERQTDEPEGSFGSLSYGAPIRSTEARWGWGTGFYFSDEVARRFDRGRVERFDAEATAADDALPIQFRRERLIGGFEVVRSFGSREKFDVSAGAEADRRAASYPLRAGVDPRAYREFVATWLPVNDTRVSPFVQLRTRRERYLRTTDLETLALQEDFRLGPELLLRAYPATSSLGSTRDLVGLKSGLSYTGPLGNGLARVVLVNTVEYELSSRHDASVRASARVTSPRLGLGRLVFDAVLRHRYENALNRFFGLGGDNRLRGYPPSGFEGSFRGPHVLALNGEFRTSPVELLSAQVGLAAFYDAGHAANRFRDLALRHSAGIGLRALFPQLNRIVFRVDWGFPLSHGYAPFPGGLFLAFGQAFGMPELESPTVMRPDLE